MVNQKKRTCITQSRKNCAIQGVCLICKQKIWLAICKFLWSLTNQNAWFVSSFCTELTLSSTVFEKNCTALNQSKWGNFFMYIISSQMMPSWKLPSVFSSSRFKGISKCWKNRWSLKVITNDLCSVLGERNNYYYYTSDSLWKIWLVESIQSIHNSLWTWHDKCIICCR